MNNKILVISGPTATGKTSLAISLSQRFNGEIISADSRQVYKGLDIGTGKDVPSGAKWIEDPHTGHGYYEIGKTKIWGYDLVLPKMDFSVAQYIQIGKRIIRDILSRNKLPILVGGTGLYIKGILEGIPTATVPRNLGLRIQLEKLNADDLYGHLAQLDPTKAGAMNSSDKKNPRRLIRAIEVAQYLLLNSKIKSASVYEFNSLSIGLTAPIEFINERIRLRVKARLVQGIEKEVKKLLRDGVNWESQSMMSLGYRQWRDYFEGAIDKEHIMEEWAKEERKYAKRQITWFKKEKDINWFDITSGDYPKNVESLVKKWYIKTDAKKS